MNILKHSIKGQDIAELITDEVLINSTDEALDLLGSMYYVGYDKIILHQKNLHPAFFDLKNKMAGDILQKFSNYRMQLLIIGDFSCVESKSLRDFIYESNKGNHVNFINSIEAALVLLNK